MPDFLPFTRPTIDEETIAGVAEVLRSGWITSGPWVRHFEQALADYLGGGRPVRSVTSATAGLEVALQVAGIGPGDEVILPAMSFAASANVIVRLGAKPVFVDVDLETRNLVAERLPMALTSRTRAIMPVHFGGLPVDLDTVYSLAGQKGLRVIEDAAHAIGTRWKSRPVGSFGDLVSFSFHPNKNITTIEGGAVTFSRPDEVAAFELHRFHGIRRDADNEVDVFLAGGKYNLSDVAARIGVAQLEKLDGFNARRRELAARYFELLAPLELGVLPARGDDGHSWHIFTLLLPFADLGMTRAQFVHAMAELGIGIGVHYPDLPGLTFYRGLGYRPEEYPNAHRIGRETVTLPLFPGMQLADVDRVCEALVKVLRSP
jgi:dTDP-4-amino-4,6-dideoxygalactose transaminase